MKVLTVKASPRYGYGRGMVVVAAKDIKQAKKLALELGDNWVTDCLIDEVVELPVQYEGVAKVLDRVSHEE